jgi:hypothetical protein
VKGCQLTKDRELANGDLVCKDCRDWLIECECSYLLSMSLKRRQIALNRLDDVRGRSATSRLRERLMALWMKRRSDKQKATDNN